MKRARETRADSNDTPPDIRPDGSCAACDAGACYGLHEKESEPVSCREEPTEEKLEEIADDFFAEQKAKGQSFKDEHLLDLKSGEYPPFAPAYDPAEFPASSPEAPPVLPAEAPSKLPGSSQQAPDEVPEALIAQAALGLMLRDDLARRMNEPQTQLRQSRRQVELSQPIVLTTALEEANDLLRKKKYFLVAAVPKQGSTAITYVLVRKTYHA